MQALIWAAHHGHKNVIFKLLELGADKNLQTKDEKTAAELAKINKHSEVLHFFLRCRFCGFGFILLFVYLFEIASEIFCRSVTLITKL